MEEKKNKKKFWIIGICIELLIIAAFAYFTFFIKKYDRIVQCELENKTENAYTVTSKDVLYINSNRIEKQKKIMAYAFQYEETYNTFKEKLAESNITSNLEGYKIEFRNDDSKYLQQVIYEYDLEKIKKDPGTTVVDDQITFNISDEEQITLSAINPDEIIKQYKELGYTCK